MHRLVSLYIVIGAVGLVLRGTDYATGFGSACDLVEVGPRTAMVWGLACVTLAALVLVGLAFKRYKFLSLTALMIACVYLMLGFFAFNAAVLTPPIDDWRFAGDLVTRAVTWLLIAAYVSVRGSVHEGKAKV